MFKIYLIFNYYTTANLLIILHYTMFKTIFDYPKIKLDYID